MRAIETFAVFDENGNMEVENKPQIKNKKVKLLILINDEEEQDFYNLSSQGLAAAYSAEEPEYNLSLINEPNPGYAGR